MELMEHQIEAIKHLDSGKVLYGGLGSGKSITVMAWYALHEAPFSTKIFVITTAKKRDSLDWEAAAAKFGIGTDEDSTLGGVLVVDSWNNIEKYIDVEDAFFVFDEQRTIGRGTWGKSFIKIAKKNKWMLLSATPGDNWLDYAPIFIANGYYKNFTDFNMQHVQYMPFVRYPQVRGYINERKLELLRNEVLVEMPYFSHTTRIPNYLEMGYDEVAFKRVFEDRWNIYKDEPIEDVAEMFRLMRRVVNSDPSRLEMVHKLMKTHPKLIIFYNFDYELDILRSLYDVVEVGEWNGHRKNPLPDTDKWVYLVQYVSGAEGWNCTETNAMILYSLTYSYKNFHQAQGRIDRLDTLFSDLYYYIFVSNSRIDLGIRENLRKKKNFNEKRFLKEIEKSRNEIH